MAIILLSDGRIDFRGNTGLQESSPEGLGPWKPVSFPSQMATEAGNHKDHLAYRRWFFGGKWRFIHIATQCFPLNVLKEHGARQIRFFPTEHRQIINPPRHHHVHTQTALEPIRRLVPPLGGMIDISMLIAFFGIMLLQQLLVSLA